MTLLIRCPLQTWEATGLQRLGNEQQQISEHASSAEELDDMSIAWVKERIETRDEIANIRTLLQDGQEHYYMFKFRLDVLCALAHGEQRLFKFKEARLLKALTLEEEVLATERTSAITRPLCEPWQVLQTGRRIFV